MTSPKQIAIAILSENLRADEHHNDVYVVAALGFSNRLGSALHRLSGAMQASAYNDAKQQLSILLMKWGKRRRVNITRESSEVVADQVLYEWMVKICISCNGTGQQLLVYSTGEEQGRGDCMECGGTGMYSPTWTERHRKMNVSFGERSWWEKRIAVGQEIVNDAYRAATSRVSAEMREL